MNSQRLQRGRPGRFVRASLATALLAGAIALCVALFAGALWTVMRPGHNRG
ncbi:MAG: hypothetical protein NTNFB02_32550 [Nitrospira sp.]